MEEAEDGALHPALRLADLLSELPDGVLPWHSKGGCRADMVEKMRDLLIPVEWACLPSPHMTPELMFKLAGDVDAMLARPDVGGAVITHGTDLMEETAFMLDLLVDSKKPVVITGSMRSHGEPGYDGLRNLGSALRACALPLPPGTGVVLLMTDKLFAAREVTKVHSMGVDAFDSPGSGPIGSCVAGGVQLFRTPVPHMPFSAKRIEPNVDLISLAPGMNGRFLACSREHGAKGLVVEAFGAGNVPPAALPELKACVDAGMPIVLTSRCIEGGVWPVYGYSGGANSLQDMGLILGGNLRAQKARLLLMVALGLDGFGDCPMAKARNVFEMYPK